MRRQVFTLTFTEHSLVLGILFSLSHLYRMRPRCHLRGRPRSPIALAPAFSKVGTLSPVWCGLAWPGPGRGVNVTPPALCGYELGEGLPAGSCPWSLGHPLPPAEPQATALQMYTTQNTEGLAAGCKCPCPSHASAHASPREGPRHKLFHLEGSPPALDRD